MPAASSEIPSDRPTSSTDFTSTADNSEPTNLMPDQMPTLHPTAETTSMNDMSTFSSITPINTNPMTPSLDEPQYTPQNPTSYPSGNTNTITSTNMFSTNVNTNTIDGNKVPTTMQTDRYPMQPTSGGYGNTQNTDIYTNEVKRPTHPSMYDNQAKPDQNPNYPYPPQYHNKYNYYQEVYPMYSHPMLYDGYPTNTGYYHPTADGYYGSTSTSGGAATPSMSTYGTSTSTMNSNTGTTYMGNGWSNADEIHRHKPHGTYPNRLPTTSSSMPTNTVYGDHSGQYPEGKYNGTRAPPHTVPYIRTYFNPDDYLTNARSEYLTE